MTIIWRAAGHRVAGAVTIACIWASGAQAETMPGASMVEVLQPPMLTAEALAGQGIFDRVCAECHGPSGAGRMGKGPPLIHPIYEPGHHGDMSFLRAVMMGAPAHHWPFGDMPPQTGLTEADVALIVAYIRQVQRTNGID